MEKLKDQAQAHPADVLAKALDRVSGLLGTLGHLFDADKENFSGGNIFVAHAISTSTTLVTDARAALDELHYSCDLTLLDGFHESDTVLEMNFDDNKQELPTFSNVAAEKNVPIAQQDDQFAKTYLELLRKLTAAEVFAAEQQALSVPGAATQLLPLLRSLREDLEKIHSAA